MEHRTRQQLPRQGDHVWNRLKLGEIPQALRVLRYWCRTRADVVAACGHLPLYIVGKHGGCCVTLLDLDGGWWYQEFGLDLASALVYCDKNLELDVWNHQGPLHDIPQRLDKERYALPDVAVR